MNSVASARELVSFETAAQASSFTFWPLVGFLGLMFFANDYSDFITGEDPLAEVTVDEKVESADEGSSVRRFTYTAFASFGLYTLLFTAGPSLRLDRFSAKMALLFVLLAGASLLWSDQAGLTLRRSILLTFAFIGVLGLAKRFSPRNLCLASFWICLGLVGVGVFGELFIGNPHAGDSYRFAGLLHPNLQGTLCACLALSAFCLMKDQPRHRTVLLFIAAAATGLLILTKSRSCAIAFLAAAGAIFLSRRSSGEFFLAALVVTAGLCGLFLVGLQWGDYGDKITETLLMGRLSHAATLSGRVPLWIELSSYISQRPLLGFGYESFWNAENILDVSASQFWNIRAAHNVLLETTLSLGLVGLAILLAAVLPAVAACRRSFLTTGDAGYGFIFALAMYGLTNGLLESGFVQPNTVPLLLACGLCRISFFEHGSEERLLPAAGETLS